MYFEEFRNLFFGESNETLKFKLDGYDVTKVQKHDKREKFCSISLSLEKGKDFNSSLEAFFQSDTEGYQAPLVKSALNMFEHHLLGTKSCR